MLTGAAPEVAERFRGVVARASLGLAVLGAVGLALGVASCHARRRQPPAVAADAGAAPAAAAVAPPPRGKQIVVAYSSNILGEYEPCG